jgi:hypothetical protein
MSIQSRDALAFGSATLAFDDGDSVEVLFAEGPWGTIYLDKKSRMVLHEDRERRAEPLAPFVPNSKYLHEPSTEEWRWEVDRLRVLLNDWIVRNPLVGTPFSDLPRPFSDLLNGASTLLSIPSRLSLRRTVEEYISRLREAKTTNRRGERTRVIAGLSLKLAWKALKHLLVIFGLIQIVSWILQNLFG